MSVKVQTLGKIPDSWQAAVRQCEELARSIPESGILNLVDVDSNQKDLPPSSEDFPEFTIAISKSWTFPSLQFSRKKFSPRSFGSSNANLEDCVSWIRHGLEDVQARAQRSRTLRDFKEQNRRLADMSDNLELRVQERTRTIENSKNEVEMRQKKMRALIRLVTELSQVETIQELMVLLKRELRKLNASGDPMVLTTDPQGAKVIYFFRGLNIFARPAGPTFDDSIKAMNVAKLQAALADSLERPVAKLLVIPMGGSANVAEHWMILENVRSPGVVPPETLNAMGTVLDRLMARSRIRFESKYWEKTFDAITDPVAIVDSDYETLRFNHAFESASLGDEQRSRECFRVFAKGEEVCSGCPKKTAQDTGKPASGEVRLRGGVFEVSSYPIQIGGSISATNFVNHYSDVTEHRQLLGRIIQNEKMTAIGLMAGSLAHELNNPLTGLSMMSQLLMKDDQIPPRIREDLGEIERAAIRCQDTVKNLLKFTNLELVEEDVVETNWKNIVDQTLPLLKMAMRYLNYENEVSDVGTIRVNSHLMGQVVFNLVNNACQAMENDGTLTIDTESEDGWSSLLIKDTGVGMDKDHVGRIFEPFFTTKEKGVGTGIGLSLVQSIIQRFGGKIEVTSQIGVGTTFKVSLPRVSVSSVPL